MRIAVTYENDEVFQHFGHSEQFKLYDVEDGAVKTSAVVDTNGSGHGALAGFLKAHNVDTLICGGIGGGAKAALAEAGIHLYSGVTGGADAAVEALLTGALVFHPDVTCNHHGDHHGGTCGEHGCGGH
ncbi:NifB/NifX family molybdenum-iron cluster-binding protein [Ligaoa zhengdingensis]|uniref:NifB/NifX family molybdenum-iron cluster-binding protein n=1 Tax=Ligaoa zhengdingensis TaxID=2763658 RepID=UPI0031BA6B0E